MRSVAPALREPGSAPEPAYRIVDGDDPAILAKIAQPAIGLALWRRRLPEALASSLPRLPPRRLPDGRVLVRLGDLEVSVAGLLAPLGLRHATTADLLAADMIDLATRFARLAETDIVDLRIEAVRHDACWKFHRDSVRLRLLTTYLGPETQIVPAAEADRALRLQRDYHGPYLPVPEHAVALFKGNQAEPGTGVVHRSPPIAGTGQYRLLLCINLPSASSPELWGTHVSQGDRPASSAFAFSGGADLE